MGESTCVLQTFSHLSDTAHQAKDDNPMRALGESISFGRFMFESLAWERRSSFNENRYLEEVKYLKPGLVAQKKAYFEAHYKKRTAAMLEQASDTANNESSDDGSHNGPMKDSKSFESDNHVADDKPGEAAVFNVREDFFSAAKTCNSKDESSDTEINVVEEVLVLVKQVDVEYSEKIESPNLHENLENKTEIEVETIKQIEQLPLKEIHAINQESQPQGVVKNDSKPSNVAGNNVSKAWPSSVSSSFIFRSEERAAKRKEYLQRLEEKSNAREAQKMEQQAKSKEKGNVELRKMRQTLGFKAKPMPYFNREIPSTPTKIKKLPLTRPRSPKFGRRPNSSTCLETKSLPPKSPCPSVKSDSFKHAMDNRSRPPSRPTTSQPKKNAHENASPNLQSSWITNAWHCTGSY